MKKRAFLVLFFLSFLGFSLQAQSESELLEICTNMSKGATYLKDYKIKLDAGNPPPRSRTSILLRKSTKYRFTICSSKDYPGEAVFKLFSNNQVEATNYHAATGEELRIVDFKCHKTGPYHIFLEFKEGKPGLAVVVISLVEKF